MDLIYPYQVLGGDVDVKVVEVRLDGQKVLPEFVDHDRRTISIKSVDRSGWQVLTLQIRLDGPMSELGAKSAPWSTVGAFASLDCARANTRTSVSLEPGRGTPAMWSGEVDLDRCDLYGSVMLGGKVVATIDNVPCRAIGVAEPWTITLDDLPRPPIGEAMTIMWENFRTPAEGRGFLTHYADDAFLVRIDATDPVLYLNRDLDGLYGLLRDRRGRPAAERALHDQTRGAIASHAWSALFLDSLVHAGLEDGEVVWPEEEWRNNALRSFLTEAYGAADAECLRQALVDLEDPDSFSNLIERIAPAAGGQARYSRLLRSSIRAVPTAEDPDHADEGEL